MRIVGLALAGVFASTIPMTGYAAGPGSNILLTYQEPSSNIVLVWDGGGPGGQAGAIGSRPSADRGPQWNGHRRFAHWGPTVSTAAGGSTAGRRRRLIGSGFLGVPSSIIRLLTGEARTEAGVIPSQ
jgi:hypothetical protein